MLCMDSATCHVVDASESMCGTCMHIHTPYVHIKYCTYKSYVMLCIFVSGTYIAITFKAVVAVGCGLAHMCTNVDIWAYAT